MTTMQESIAEIIGRREEGDNFTAAHLGHWNNLENVVYEGVGDYRTTGKLFLKDLLGLTGMELSLNRVPVGGGTPFGHGHKNNEELYLVLSGEGEVWVDGQRIAMTSGSMVRIAPNGVRHWRNIGDTPLDLIIIQANVDGLKTWIYTDFEMHVGVPW